ncbi:hypothetical protein RND81_14G130400 [Saponaria officinalis]|uniref:BED-type domain-containing protein n=1 Tax=Saponaria officinalis TaxID=3572 RepID=A0AAW1GS05_SAPOF
MVLMNQVLIPYHPGLIPDSKLIPSCKSNAFLGGVCFMRGYGFGIRNHTWVMASEQRRVRGRGSSRVPSPLGISSSPGAKVGENVDNSMASSEWRRRKWTSTVWRHYELSDEKNYEDGIPRAICKYCNGGPTYANSSLGTSNFKGHIESCRARNSGTIGEMVLGNEGLLVKKIDQFHYKEKVALAIIRHGYPFTYAEHEGNRDIYLYLKDNVKFMSGNTAKNHCMKIHKREKKTLGKEWVK